MKIRTPERYQENPQEVVERLNERMPKERASVLARTARSIEDKTGEKLSLEDGPVMDKPTRKQLAEAELQRREFLTTEQQNIALVDRSLGQLGATTEQIDRIPVATKMELLQLAA